MAEGQYTLFGECAIRGWLAAILDFPHFKTRNECLSLSKQMMREMNVCCISDTYMYEALVTAAYVNAYAAVKQVSQRESVVMASILKPLPQEDALRLLRVGILRDAKEEIDKFYARYQAARIVSSL